MTADQPTKALAGYATVDLRPGQSKVVKVRIDGRSLQHWDVASHQWTTSVGSRALWAGASATDLPLSTTITTR